MSELHPDVKALLAHVQKMRPDPCCASQPMRESNGKVTMCCAIDCPWSRLDLLIVNVSLNMVCVGEK